MDKTSLELLDLLLGDFEREMESDSVRSVLQMVRGWVQDKIVATKKLPGLRQAMLAILCSSCGHPYHTETCLIMSCHGTCNCRGVKG